MKKIKSFFKQHYKKFVTFAVISVLSVLLLFSQVFAVQYKYMMFDYFNKSTYYTYKTYSYTDKDPSNYITSSGQVPIDDYNNRFVLHQGVVSTSSPLGVKWLQRFDLRLTFKGNDFVFLEGDVLTFWFYMSGQCWLYHRDYWGVTSSEVDNSEYLPCNYYLNYFRVWFDDDSTMVFYPEKKLFYSSIVTDNEFKFVTEPLKSNKPRIKTFEFSFELTQGACFGNYTWGDTYGPSLNIWFNDFLTVSIERDTANKPIYTAPDDTIVNDHNQLEQDINSSIQSGLDESSNFFTDLGSIFHSDSRLGRGVMFVTNVMNYFLNIEIFSILGQFALSLGLFGFLVGIVQLVKSSKERHDNDRKK